MPLKKSVRARKSPRLKKPRWMKFARLMRENATVVIPLAAICLLAVAGVIANQASPSAETVRRSTDATKSAADTLAPSAAPTAEPARDPMPDSSTPVMETKEAHVTITGCLERSDEAFRLKDTSGTDAPKARNWRWGFLKKGPTTVQVVDGSKSVRLRDHVGQRVTVTGNLVDREMQVRSLQAVSTSCEAPARVKI
jgi:hypothetical protein